jgi:hypothetical protein
MNSNPVGNTFDRKISQDYTYVGQWFDPWQDYFKIFTIYMYKWHFGKPNIEIWKTHLSINSQICKLYIQISNIHMCVVPGPASQDAVFKREYASSGLPCRLSWPGRPVQANLPTFTLSWLPCPSCPLLAVMPLLSCYDCPLSFFFLSWLSCHYCFSFCPLQLSLLGGPVQDTRPSCSVPAVMGCPYMTILHKQSSRIKNDKQNILSGDLMEKIESWLI